MLERSLILLLFAVVIGIVVLIVKAIRSALFDTTPINDCVAPQLELIDPVDKCFMLSGGKFIILRISQDTLQIPWPQFLVNDKDHYSGKYFIAHLGGKIVQMGVVTGEELLDELIVNYNELEKIWEEKNEVR